VVKVIVTGGRGFFDRKKLYDALDYIALSTGRIDLIAEGGARGADRLAQDYAREKGIVNVTYHADWEKFGKGAGHKRNQYMIDSNLDAYLVAMPGGKGTEDCIRRAEKAGLTIFNYHKEPR